MSDYPNIDKMLQKFRTAVDGKSWAEQIAYCYDLPITQAQGFVVMMEALVAEEREACAQVADNYGREGDRLSKEYACEMADELAARIRSRPTT